MSFRNDSPSKFMHFCLRQVTPNQFKLIQGGDSEHLKSSQGLASLPPITHVHYHHHHWKSWFLEKLFSDCRTPVAFVSRYLVTERIILFLSKYKKTRGSLQLWMFHSLLNLEQALKYVLSTQFPNHLSPITYVHSHHHHHWKNWFLKKLFTDCRTPVAFVSRYLVTERLILFLSKYKKTRGSLQLWMFHSLLNLEQALKYRVINSISYLSALFSSYQVFPKLLNPSCLEVGQFCPKTNKILIHSCYRISWSKHLGTYLNFHEKADRGGGIYWREGA